MKFIREPLVHFLVLGTALFGLFAWRGTAITPVARMDQIIITTGLIDNLRTSFERMNGHPPDAKEMDRAIEAYVREEVLNREARTLGLDRDDSIVRQRLAQRMEFIATAEVESRAPSDEELKSFFRKNPNLFKHTDGSTPEFSDVKDDVQLAWFDAQRQMAADAAYEKMRTHYTVIRQDEADTQKK